MEVGNEIPVENCVSDTSSISAASDPSEDRKMKGKIVEGEEMDPPKQISHPYKEREFIEYLNMESPDEPSNLLSSSRKRSRNQDKKELLCTFCNKTFNNSQALGGHQNAHKHERAIAKRGKESEAAMTLRYPEIPWYPYSHIRTASANGYFNGSLGHRLQSPILRRPETYHSNHAYTLAGVRQGLNEWRTRPIETVTNTQTELARLRMGDYYHAGVANNSGFRSPGLTTMSMYNGNAAAHLFRGYPPSSSATSITASSNPARSTSSIAATSIAAANANVNTFGGGNGVVVRLGPLENHHNQREEHEEIDLSLKL